MQDRIYLLSISEFMEESEGEELMNRAIAKVDESRREKATRIKQSKAKACSLGAGLLLQLAVQNGLKQEKSLESLDIHSNLTRYTVREALAQIESPISLEFSYGKSGKPYLKKYPIHFNLSHSGEYVICTVSEQEIGVDIQEHREGNMEVIAKRYFAPSEIQALEACPIQERTKVFFDMWAAKEAYGKYTGGGITESLELEIPAGQVAMQLIHSIPGYSLAVCKAI